MNNFFINLITSRIKSFYKTDSQKYNQLFDKENHLKFE